MNCQFVLTTIPTFCCILTLITISTPLQWLTCGTLNVRSIGTKFDAIKQLRVDTRTDILCLSETWHEDFDSVPIKRLRSEGLQVLERARPILLDAELENISFVNHGGIAIVTPTTSDFQSYHRVMSHRRLSTFVHVFAHVALHVLFFWSTDQLWTM